MPYDFNQEGYRQFQEDILAADGDQATLTSVLAAMQQTFTESFALVETNKTEMEAIKKENERLVESNMGLFLQIGEQAKKIQDKQVQKPLAGIEEPPKQTVREYMNDFFNKTGGY